MSCAAASADDLYDIGREWHCSDFANQWLVDAVDLSRALNSCAFSMTLTVGGGSAGQRKKELERIASTGQEFARALADAGDASIFYLMAGLVPRALRNDITVDPDRHRQMVVGQVQKIADQAKDLAGALKVTRKPNSNQSTQAERCIVGSFASLWHRARGEWPSVTDRKGGSDGDRRGANEAGRFVIAGASEFFGATLSDPRLRTALRSIQKPTAET